MAEDGWNDDGWGDDDALEDIIADENETAGVIAEQETDGWGDDDLDLDDVEVTAPTLAPAPMPAPAPSPAPMPASATVSVPASMPVAERIEDDGWNDDLEGLSENLSDENSASPSPMMQQQGPTPAPMPLRAPAPASMYASEITEEDGWNDDLEGLSEDLSAEETTFAPNPAPAPATMMKQLAPAPAPAPVPLNNPRAAPMFASERMEDDGWNDELEDLSENLSNTDTAPAPTPAPTPISLMRQPPLTAAPAPIRSTSAAPSPMFESEKINKDGWNDELEDPSENLSSGDVSPQANMTRCPGYTPGSSAGIPNPTNEPVIKSDGWDDDLDDLSTEETRQTSIVPSPVPATTPMGTTSKVNAALLGSAAETENEKEQGFTEHVSTAAPSTADTEEFLDAGGEMGWGDDEDIFSDTIENPELPQTPVPAPLSTPHHHHHHKLDDVHQELVDYVESLMVQLPSVNAVLEAEYNTPEKAHELFCYYNERPQLRQYTIEKEVDRMDYQVVLEHEGHSNEPVVIDNKEEVTRMFQLQPEMDMMIRCSNQSLLADLLQVMTGSDRIVRPQYMATCLAQSCLFALHLRQGTEGGLVECTSQLALSLPESSGKRYPVANMDVRVVFSIPANPQREEPTIQFKLQNMKIVLPNLNNLRPTAEFLLESGLLDHPPISPFPESPAGVSINNSGDFRDVFLQQSQNMLQSSTVGLKSAWKQIDSVAGLGSKMNMMKKILPTGDSSVLEEAMREQEAYQRQMKSQEGNAGTSMTVETGPASYPPSTKAPQQQQRALPQQRPTSILGSVWGRLAKTVTLPEEDTSIYQEYAQSQKTFSADSGITPYQTAQNAQSIQEPFVHLYRKEEQQKVPTLSAPVPTSNPPTKASPWLSRLTEASPSIAKPMPAPTALSVPIREASGIGSEDVINESGSEENTHINDGWEKDDDLILDNIKEETEMVSNVSDSRDVADSRDASPREAEILANSDQSSKATVHNLTRDKISNGVETVLHSYSAEDDIIATRKRWVNPRPGFRRLKPLLS